MAKANKLASQRPGVRELLKTVGGRVVRPGRIAAIAAARGLPTGWAERETKEYVLDADTVPFEVPLARLAGAAGLDFAQQVWMLGPSAFEYVVLGDVALVRLWWDPDPGAPSP
jgi:hypothetical protein